MKCPCCNNERDYSQFRKIDRGWLKRFLMLDRYTCPVCLSEIKTNWLRVYIEVGCALVFFGVVITVSMLATERETRIFATLISFLVFLVGQVVGRVAARYLPVECKYRQ